MRVAFGTVAANAWGKKFLRKLSSELDAYYANETRGRQKRQEMLGRVRDTAQQLFDEGKGTLPDKQAHMIRGTCSLVLAAYRIIKDQSHDQQQAFTLVKAAFQRTYQGMGKFIMRPLLWVSRDPVKTLSSSERLRSWSQSMYGSSMGFDQAVDADGYTLIVNRCAFHQFFVDHDEATADPLDLRMGQELDGCRRQRSTRPVRVRATNDDFNRSRCVPVPVCPR